MFDRDSNSRPPLPGAGVMEDYIMSFLVVAGILCFLGLFTIWAIFGYPFALVAGFAADRMMRRN